MNKKVLILIVSSDTYPSRRNKSMQEKTWILDQQDNQQIYFYESGEATGFGDNNTIFVESGKSTLDMSTKNILAFDFALQNLEFDYLFRTTTTSYVNLKILNSFIEENLSESEFVYSGKLMSTKGSSEDEVIFVSGAGIIFNRNTVQKIVDNKSKVNLELWDDVGIGKILNAFNVEPLEGKMNVVEGNIFNQQIDFTHYHYRCRIDNHFGYPRFLEVYVIKYLHKYINGVQINRLTSFIFSVIFEIGKLFYIQYPFLKLLNLIKLISKVILPKYMFRIIKKNLSTFYKKIQLKYFKY